MLTIIVVCIVDIAVLLVLWGVSAVARRYVLENDGDWRTELFEWLHYTVAILAGGVLTITYPSIVTSRTVVDMVTTPASILDPLYLFVSGILAMLTILIVDRHAFAYVLTKKFQRMMLKLTMYDKEE